MRRDPEKTYEKILEVSSKLFFEKGYENTSLQDIVNNLDGLTKGAVYHHFSSKDDILDAVLVVTNGRQALRLVPMERNARYVPVRE